jgi:hypothetical protein
MLKDDGRGVVPVARRVGELERGCAKRRKEE